MFCRVRPLVNDEMLGHATVEPDHMSFPEDPRILQLEKVPETGANDVRKHPFSNPSSALFPRLNLTRDSCEKYFLCELADISWSKERSEVRVQVRSRIQSVLLTNASLR